MENTVQNSHEYRNLPVAQLQESTTNPRRRFDEHSLAELAASFQAQGVLQPLLVRTIEDDKYEVIAGARRLAAGPGTTDQGVIDSAQQAWEFAEEYDRLLAEIDALV